MIIAHNSTDTTSMNIASVKNKGIKKMAKTKGKKLGGNH